MSDALCGHIDDPSHHQALVAERERLLAFYEAGIRDEAGGFHWLGADGRPQPSRAKPLWLAARTVHCFAVAEMLGRRNAGDFVRHGLAFLQRGLHDRQYGGWYASVGPQGDDAKHGYGHAFVLLAACSAARAGHDTRDLLIEVARVIDDRFWRSEDKLCRESYDRTWHRLDPYRGANTNMHMTEAFLAAASVTGDGSYLDRALCISRRLIGDLAAAHRWRLPEHYDERWRPLYDYNRERPADPFRPYGATVGHWLEWTRLLLHLRVALGPDRESWILSAAKSLFDQALFDGWDARAGGFHYTVDWDGRPAVRDHFHWPLTEGIGAAAALFRATGETHYAEQYRRFWRFCDAYLIDRARGSWWHQLDADNRPLSTTWDGKPDLYHTLQATLFATTPPGYGFGDASPTCP